MSSIGDIEWNERERERVWLRACLRMYTELYWCCCYCCCYMHEYFRCAWVFCANSKRFNASYELLIGLNKRALLLSENFPFSSNFFGNTIKFEIYAMFKYKYRIRAREHKHTHTHTRALHATSMDAGMPETFNIDFDFVYRSVCLWAHARTPAMRYRGGELRVWDE